MVSKPTLLIDGDGVAFKAACACQESIDWGDGISINTDAAGAERHMDKALAFYREHLEAEHLIVCLGDQDNWRKKLWGNYKANRREREQPLLREHCNQYLRDSYASEVWPRLEADDVMGILSQTIENSIIVSVDKDMKTIPCRLYNPMHHNDGVQTIGIIEAFRNHMLQTLMGDTADGYKGCPGIGRKRAAAIIDPLLPNLRRRGSAFDAALAFTIGRKNVWKAVTAAFAQKNLPPREALRNAQLAYILQKPEEYNRDTHMVCLWRSPT